MQDLQTCKDLEHLAIPLADPKSIFSANKATKKSIISLFSHLTKLKVLSLSRPNNDFTKTEFISLLKNKNLANLERLELKDYAISEAAFKKKVLNAIISNFQELKHLRLNCVITKQDVEYLIKVTRSLTNAIFVLCTI